MSGCLVERVDHDTDEVKANNKARERLAQVLGFAFFPNEVPRVGQRVQIAYLDSDEDTFILEGTVLNRGYDVEKNTVNPPKSFYLEISIFDVGNEAGEQDYLALDYNSGTGEWNCYSCSNGEWYPAVLKTIS